MFYRMSMCKNIEIRVRSVVHLRHGNARSFVISSLDPPGALRYRVSGQPPAGGSCDLCGATVMVELNPAAPKQSRWGGARPLDFAA